MSVLQMIFDFNSIFSIFIIFCIGAIIYKDPNNKEKLLSLGTFCKDTAFLVSLISILFSINDLRDFGDFRGKLSYSIVVSIYGIIINLLIQLHTKSKFKVAKKLYR